MATRGIQLVRTDDTVSGVVKFYDRRETDVKKAFVGQVDINALLESNRKAVVKLAVHGATQNILDASNKLEGDDRLAYIAQMCEHLQSGGWASAPVDEAAATQRAVEAINKLPAEVRAQLLASLQQK